MNPAVIYIMGVSGSGKTTVGTILSAKTAIPFIDADDFHSLSNKEKMKAGHPLTDDDRAAWLLQVNAVAKKEAANKGVIIACSALKEKYRKVLASGITIPVRWIFLQGNYELIHQRMEQRTAHYMPAALLQSQFDALEVPDDAITLNIEYEPAQLVAYILSVL